MYEDLINPNANVTPYMNDLVNVSNNTIYKIIHVFTNALGGPDIFFGLLLFFVVAGYYLNSEGNKLVTLAVLLMGEVVSIIGVMFSSIVSLLFTIVIAFLITHTFMKIFYGER